jgi:PAS domain S-box-containing protein
VKPNGLAKPLFFVKTKPETTTSLNHLYYLPQYAQYLLLHRLDDMARFQIDFSEGMSIPLLKFFEKLSREQLFELTKKALTKLLTNLSENNARLQIEESLQQWQEGLLPVISKNDIVAEDITLITYLRKRTFLQFITDYSPDVEQAINVVKEIDLFLSESETASTNFYINLLKETISESSHLIEKVNNTIPGAVYVFDLAGFKGIYSNNKLAAIIGYDQDELNRLGENALDQLIHPDDKEGIKHNMALLDSAGDGEVRIYRYRVKDKKGNYHWLANYESVFKRDEKGKVIQTIGITLNVDNEEKISDALRQNETLHEQAEALTHLGSYTWDVKTNGLKWSDELYRIYGLDPAKDTITFELAGSFNAPGETPNVRKEYEQAIARKESFDFYYRINAKDGQLKILHARGKMRLDKNGEVETIIGTAQDVTEKQMLISKLRQNESIYKQAEELANMGNWSWDIINNKLEWTDQLYRIYGLQPQSEEITLERFLSFVHPDDREYVSKGVDTLLKETLVDYTFRIITADGKTKILRSVAQVQKNEKGEPVLAIGTERDTTEKQTLIDKLKQSEGLYKQAQALAHLGNWSFDIQANSYTWSDEMYRIYEIERGADISFEDWKNFIHPADKEEVLLYFEECLQQKKNYDKSHRIVLKNGKIKIIHRKGEFIVDSKGNAIKMIGTTQDVTEEYRIQQELKDNQTFIRKITDATPSIIASYNINTGKYVFISEGLQKLLGYDPDEVMAKGVAFFAGIIHPDDVEPVMAKNAKALQDANAHPDGNDIVVEFTYRMRHRDGGYRWFHTYGTIFDRNSQNKVEHVLNISLDVTEQMEATEKIKEQEHFIQQIADASPTILYLYDVKEQSIAYINREIFFVLGYSPEEIIREGNRITEALYHPDDYPLLPGRKQSGKSFQQVDSMIQYECRMKKKEGDWRWLLVREIVFKTDDEGNITQILGAALDINRRKEMEKTILQNTLLLEQSNASLEEFAYVASHDLKEPLRKISTFGDRLVASQANSLTPEGKNYLNKIIDASQRMQTMINDLLSISMISGNTAFEKFSLQKILEETIQTLEYKIEQQNAIVTADPLPEATIIPAQFRQLFQNLLSNSLKFVQPGVQPVITITHQVLSADEMIHYQLAAAKEYHKLEFADNGIGFENEFAGKIFAIFQRLHGRSEYEGSGIGLAICKKIVEHHGGLIYSSGELNKGATFTIILPA